MSSGLRIQIAGSWEEKGEKNCRGGRQRRERLSSWGTLWQMTEVPGWNLCALRGWLFLLPVFFHVCSTLIPRHCVFTGSNPQPDTACLQAFLISLKGRSSNLSRASWAISKAWPQGRARLRWAWTHWVTASPHCFPHPSPISRSWLVVHTDDIWEYDYRYYSTLLHTVEY